MAIYQLEPMTDDVEILSKLGDNPGSDDGLSTQELKSKFDLGSVLLKENLNRVIAAVNSLLSSAGNFLQGGTMAGNLNMNQYRLYGIKSPEDAGDAANKGYVDASEKKANEYTDSQKPLFLNVTIPSVWSGTAPYTVTVAVQGVNASGWDVHIYPVYSADAAQRAAQREAYNCISLVTPGENQITFTCDEDKPAVAIPIKVEVRKV